MSGEESDSRSGNGDPNAALPLSASVSTEASSDTSSLSYNDEPGLLADLQTLLCDLPEVSDTTLIIPDDGSATPSAEHIPIHTQLLSARSSHFSLSLNPPWRRPSLVLAEDDPGAIRDVLEFLYSGAVRLETESGSAMHVAALAHCIGLADLEEIALEHISSSLSPATFLRHLKAAFALPAVPDPLVALLADCASAFPARILTATALTEAKEEEAIPLVRCVLLLLAGRLCPTTTDARSLKDAPDASSALEGVIAWSARHHAHGLGGAFRNSDEAAAAGAEEAEEVAGGDSSGARAGETEIAAPLKNDPSAASGSPGTCQPIPSAQPLARLLESASDAAERAALVSVLISPSVRVFSRRVEPLGVLSAREVLAKYRDAAVAPRVFESAHPHRSEKGSATRTRVELEEGAQGARVRFDYRTSLREGSRLCFVEDPGGAGEEVYFCLKGTVAGDAELVETGIVVPRRVFSFVLLSERASGDEVDVGSGSRWGFRFVVEPYFSLPQEGGLDVVEDVEGALRGLSIT